MSTANINAHIPPVYAPAADSLPVQVMYFFKCNQEEELTIDDIVDKYGPARGGVHTQLKRAIDAGMLARYQNEDGDWVYKAGPKLFSHLPAGRTEQATTLATRPARKPRTHRPPAPVPDLASIPIESDVPLIGYGRNVVKTDWVPLFKRLKPGQSCKLPLAVKYNLSKAITEAHKAELGTFAIRTFKDTEELRLWRTA